MITGVVLANMNVGVQYSLLSVGSGMLVGLRINVSMMIGGDARVGHRAVLPRQVRRMLVDDGGTRDRDPDAAARCCSG